MTQVQPVHHADAGQTVPEDEPFSPRAATPSRAGKPRRKPEAEIVKEAKAMLNGLPRSRFIKIHGGPYGNVGEPDLDGCVTGRTCKFEAKAIGEKPTPAQLGTMRKWQSVGALVGWFTNNDHLHQLLDHLHDPGFVADLGSPGCVCARHGGTGND